MTHMLKEFVRELKTYLKEHNHLFTMRVQGEGGCETCGYGAPEYFDLDMDQLQAEIDKFATEFERKT